MTSIALERRRAIPAIHLTPGWWQAWLPSLLAGGLAALGAMAGWRGTDLPAQLYRVALFRSHGLTLWDSQWYGGHWLLNYSIAYPPVAGTLGVTVTTVLCASTAAFAFDRLVVGQFGRTARVGSLLFAVGTVQQVAIGQLAFLLGECFALLACCAASRRRWPLAAALAIAAALASPLAGGFLALAGVAWLVVAPRNHRVGLAAMVLGAAIPVGVVAIVFPGTGSFPFPFGDLAFELPAIGVMWLLVPRDQRTLRTGVALYALATIASFLLPTPIGGNVGRLGECLAIPLGACLLWAQRRWLFVALAIPMALWQFTPAWGAIANHNAHQPSTHHAYYTPLLDFLARSGHTIGRVEIVPTELHWEAVYVAPTVPLARGWERQLDIADNPIFYAKDRFDAVSYRTWLIDNGVRYVALPDAQLDFAGAAEGRLVSEGVLGLRPVWEDAHWRVFAVDGSPGIVDGGQLVSLNGGSLVVHATEPGPMLVRVRYNPHWTLVAGSACLSVAPNNWMDVDAKQPGDIDLEIQMAVKKHAAC